MDWRDDHTAGDPDLAASNRCPSSAPAPPLRRVLLHVYMPAFQCQLTMQHCVDTLGIDPTPSLPRCAATWHMQAVVWSVLS